MVSNDRVRVTIKKISPEVEDGRFPVKRVAGDSVNVEAVIFADGHDLLSARLLFRKESEPAWQETAMESSFNDVWRGSFVVGELGRYLYTVTAWIDRFKTWRQDFSKRINAGEKDIDVYLLSAIQLIKESMENAPPADKDVMAGWINDLESPGVTAAEKIKLVMSGNVSAIMDKYSNRKFALTYHKQLVVVVEPEKAAFSTWYEMFPRSCSPQPGKHGTFKDCENRLPYIAEMGFDVLYLPPIHPIGHTNRKGKNNALVTTPGDPGTPWAIGSEEGGHKAVHPELGSIEDFQRLLGTAKKHGIDIALDIAFQCSPDHPYVKDHPEWFYHRPDGTIQYAENPPKKYEDIYPLNFESDGWKSLWEELKSVILFWIEHGVRIFRIDNPHTKSFYFWEWVIGDIKAEYPEVIFLAEAFTRPNVMYQLAESGFSQSYTYFAWRNTKYELTRYFQELTRSEVKEYFHPNLWPNTPDILTEYLQSGGRPAFIARFVLAATLGANYGIYGPAFELCESQPREPGSEEYLNSEKYEIKNWDISRTDSLKEIIGRINNIRRENAALQRDSNLVFHQVNNEMLIAYSKHNEDFSNVVLTVVNLDPHHTHSGWLELSLDELGLDTKQPYQVHDLLSGARYIWYGMRNYVELNPQVMPAHIFILRRRIRTERDFDYYL